MRGQTRPQPRTRCCNRPPLPAFSWCFAHAIRMRQSPLPRKEKGTEWARFLQGPHCSPGAVSSRWPRVSSIYPMGVCCGLQAGAVVARSFAEVHLLANSHAEVWPPKLPAPQREFWPAAAPQGEFWPQQGRAGGCLGRIRGGTACKAKMGGGL